MYLIVMQTAVIYGYYKLILIIIVTYSLLPTPYSLLPVPFVIY
ncbi:hypothetical protein [Moorena sp. SIOASIH]|nr:hypothetical protein [Moorena sp. SIOASIH]